MFGKTVKEIRVNIPAKNNEKGNELLFQENSVGEVPRFVRNSCDDW